MNTPHTANDRLIQEYIVREALSVLVFIVISSELIAEQHCFGGCAIDCAQIEESLLAI